MWSKLNKYTVWIQCRIFYVKPGGLCSSQWVLNGWSSGRHFISKGSTNLGTASVLRLHMSVALSSTLRMEAAVSSITSVDIYQRTRRHISEDSNLLSKARITSNVTWLCDFQCSWQWRYSNRAETNRRDVKCWIVCIVTGWPNNQPPHFFRACFSSFFFSFLRLSFLLSCYIYFLLYISLSVWLCD